MLYLKDSYLKNFEAKILSINENKLILDQTAFYSKSGGQPSDIGSIHNNNNKEIEIVDTYKDENNYTVHISNDKIEFNKNEIVNGEINWEKRYKYMRMHSALHILCSVVNFGVTGGQIGYEKSRLDFDIKDSIIDKEEIQNRIDDLIKNDHEITYKWITAEELDKKPELVKTMSVKPPIIADEIRLVKIGEIDLQPCGGTHVKNTKEIGNIKIIKIENKGKRNRRINISLN